MSAVRALPADVRARLSAQQLADVALVERLLAKSKRGEVVSAEEKQVLRIVARRAPIAVRDGLVRHVEQLLAREAGIALRTAAPRYPVPVEGPFPTPALREQFVDDVLSLARGTYELPSGERVQGEALSALQRSLTSRSYGGLPGGRRWTGLSRYCDFVSALESAGFRVVRARTVRYFRGGGGPKAGQACRVVTL